MNARKLRLESLEERALLAVTAGGFELAAALPEPAGATGWIVNTLDDATTWDTADDILSLREAIGRAQTGDTIAFDSSLAGGTITLSGTELSIDKGIAIDASSIGGITIDADGQSRVFYVNVGSAENPVELISLTITGGYESYGGGIYNDGALTLTSCTVAGNIAPDGGGICNYGTLTLTNSTVSGNTAHKSHAYYGEGGYGGGGIYNYGTLTLTNCTVSGNTASGFSYGGGIYNVGTSYLYNTIIAQNTASYSGNDVYRYSGSLYAHNTLSSFTGWMESENCLTYDSSQPLFKDAVHGDYTLAENSQAIDKGNNDYVTTETDLTGNPRILNGTVDLGAYEYGSSSPAEQLAVPAITTGNRGIFVSYGANRHQITWTAVENASGYELAYTTDGVNWSSAWVGGTSGAVGNLTYGSDVTYRVRALGEGLYINSDWSETKTFRVCPMDINNDGMISGFDRSLMASAWGTEEGDDKFRYYSDINGDGEVGGFDRNFLGMNWGLESDDDNLTYPRTDITTPVITTGNRGVYVSYGANRHYIQWGAVTNALGYEVRYTTDGTNWLAFTVTDSSAVVTGLTYAADVTYRVRALGDGVSYTDSDWSRAKTFNVCPMDINNDGIINDIDSSIMWASWLSEEGEDEYQFYADIDADYFVNGVDRNFLEINKGKKTDDDELTYPRPLAAADTVFAAYDSGDIDIDLDVF